MPAARHARKVVRHAVPAAPKVVRKTRRVRVPVVTDKYSLQPAGANGASAAKKDPFQAVPVVEDTRGGVPASAADPIDDGTSQAVEDSVGVLPPSAGDPAVDETVIEDTVAPAPGEMVDPADAAGATAQATDGTEPAPAAAADPGSPYATPAETPDTAAPRALMLAANDTAPAAPDGTAASPTPAPAAATATGDATAAEPTAAVEPTAAAATTAETTTAAEPAPTTISPAPPVVTATTTAAEPNTVTATAATGAEPTIAPATTGAEPAATVTSVSPPAVTPTPTVATTSTTPTPTTTTAATESAAVQAAAAATSTPTAATPTVATVSAPAPWTVTVQPAADKAAQDRVISVSVDGADLVVAVDGVASSRPSTSVTSLTITGTDAADALSIDGTVAALTLPIVFDAGTGVDTIRGPPADTTWSITGDGAGTVGNVAFTGVENLVGAADNEDTFVVEPGGAIEGTIDGGPGGYDSFVIAGHRDDVVSNPVDRNSGNVIVDGVNLRYAGMEPFGVLQATNITVNGAADAASSPVPQGDKFVISPYTDASSPTAACQTAGNCVRIDNFDGLTGLVPIAEFTYFVIAGTSSLTINGGAGSDKVEFKGDYLVTNSALTVNAESIKVDAGVTINVGHREHRLQRQGDRRRVEQVRRHHDAPRRRRRDRHQPRRRRLEVRRRLRPGRRGRRSDRPPAVPRRERR